VLLYFFQIQEEQIVNDIQNEKISRIMESYHLYKTTEPYRVQKFGS